MAATSHFVTFFTSGGMGGPVYLEIGRWPCIFGQPHSFLFGRVIDGPITSAGNLPVGLHPIIKIACAIIFSGWGLE